MYSNMYYKEALCASFEERFSFQKGNLILTAEGRICVVLSTEMGIDFFMLVFLLHSGGHHRL